MVAGGCDVDCEGESGAVNIKKSDKCWMAIDFFLRLSILYVRTEMFSM